MIVDDNQFGTPKSDALRRDFTVNALFYDAHRNEVIDYVDGLTDLENRLLRTIGHPVVRFQEDPVRMLRAVKFAARLDFDIEPETKNAILSERVRLAKRHPRLYEELTRLIGGGAAVESLRLLDELRLLEVLFQSSLQPFEPIKPSEVELTSLAPSTKPFKESKKSRTVF